MLTLSDKILVTISYSAPTTDTYYTYYISTSESYVDAIYKGRFFAKKGSTSVNLYLNDILTSQRPTHNILGDYTFYVVPEEYQLVKRYYVLAYVPAITTQYKDVLLTYKYPFKDYEMGGVQVASKGVMPLLLGVQNYDVSALSEQTEILYPTYPKIGNKEFMITLVFCNGLNFNADTTKMVTLDASNNVVDSVYNTAFLNFTSRIAVQSSYMPFSSNATGIGIQNKAISETKVVTGKKLWKIEVNDQWNDGDSTIISLAENLGYDEYYTRHFYIETDVPSNLLYFIYETNDEDEIEQAFTDAECTYQHSYEEMSSVDLWNVTYTGNDIDFVNDDAYDEFINFMTGAIDVIDEDYINNVIGITRSSGVYGDINLLLPYKIYKDTQFDVWKSYFESYKTASKTDYEDYFEHDSSSVDSTEYEETYKEEMIYGTLRFANFDTCVAHYYLQWIDRFGGVQCQPFDQKETKTISYEKTNITNQYGENRLTNSINTLSFEINTGWLNDEYMPIYESIFISPFIKLYDTVADKVYDVISVDTEYTEKTKKNQKTLFNLTIKLNVNTDENVLY